MEAKEEQPKPTSEIHSEPFTGFSTIRSDETLSENIYFHREPIPHAEQAICSSSSNQRQPPQKRNIPLGTKVSKRLDGKY